MNEMHRAAGRSGVGAVMGSKNLKAIAVRGSGTVTIADPDGFKAAVDKARAKIQAHPVGGAGLTPLWHRRPGQHPEFSRRPAHAQLPGRLFPDRRTSSAARPWPDTLLSGPKGCFSCVISCGRVTKITEPRITQGEGEGPEYETAWGFGADCGIDNLDAVTKANYLLQRTRAGHHHHGRDHRLRDGPVRGRHHHQERHRRRRADLRQCRGDGRADAQDRRCARASATNWPGLLSAGGACYGHPEYSMSVKKQEMPAYDPRAVQGIGLHYATSNRGGCHVRGYTIAVEVLGNPFKMDPAVTDGKADLVHHLPEPDGGAGRHGRLPVHDLWHRGRRAGRMLSTITGVPYTTEAFMKAGERIWNLERLWNLKTGLHHPRRHPARAAVEVADQDRAVQGPGEPPGGDAAGIL